MKNCYYVTVPTEPEALRAFVAECDQRFEREMDAVVELVASMPDLRLLGLTGPTCSGKTTAAKKLTQCLESHGHRVHVISIDDFYYNSEYLKNRPGVDPTLEIDYDSEDTIDYDLLREKTEQLLAGKPTRMPRFNFRSGLREEGLTLTPHPEDVFLFEGIQVLYPKLNEILSGGSYRCIYISPEYGIEVGGEQFEPNEIRLMRRLVRDSLYRASNAAFTFLLWEGVRKNEEKSIFPNTSACHYFINSTMPYEIGMLKPYLEALLAHLPETDENRPVADTILNKLKNVAVVPAEYITENSLYKEFI